MNYSSSHACRCPPHPLPFTSVALGPLLPPSSLCKPSSSALSPACLPSSQLCPPCISCSSDHARPAVGWEVDGRWEAYWGWKAERNTQQGRGHIQSHAALYSECAGEHLCLSASLGRGGYCLGSGFGGPREDLSQWLLTHSKKGVPRIGFLSRPVLGYRTFLRG